MRRIIRNRRGSCVSPAMAAAFLMAMASLPGAGAAAQPSEPDAARPKNPLDAVAYFEAHRDDISLVVYTVGEDGEPIEGDHSIFYNADEPMPLASTAKIAILAAYAREVGEGRLDPEQQVSLGEWDLHYLPGTDGGAHAAALGELRIVTDELGFATDPMMMVPIRRLVHAMMRHSDNAASDLLLQRIGRDAVAETMREAGVEIDLDIPGFLGLFLYWQNHERRELSDEAVETLIELDPEMRMLEMSRLQSSYMMDEWRESELRWRRTHRPSPESIEQQRAFADVMGPRATARDVARLLALSTSENFLSPESSAVMRRGLEWPMGIPGARRTFERMGAKGGALAGVITDTSYVVMREGDFAGKQRVAALLMRRIPMEAWEAMMSSFAHQQAALGAAAHSGFHERIREALLGEAGETDEE